MYWCCISFLISRMASKKMSACESSNSHTATLSFCAGGSVVSTVYGIPSSTGMLSTKYFGRG
jgi:hypothetical protein